MTREELEDVVWPLLRNEYDTPKVMRAVDEYVLQYFKTFLDEFDPQKEH